MIFGNVSAKISKFYVVQKFPRRRIPLVEVVFETVTEIGRILPAFLTKTLTENRPKSHTRHTRYTRYTRARRITV